MTVNRPMEHWDSSRICDGCINKECKDNFICNSYMNYSADTERYECMERIIEVVQTDDND